MPLDPGPDQPLVDAELHAVAHGVHQEFDNHLDPSMVEECLQKVAARFDGAPIRAYVPLLVGRYVREELKTRLRQIQ